MHLHRWEQNKKRKLLGKLGRVCERFRCYSAERQRQWLSHKEKSQKQCQHNAKTNIIDNLTFRHFMIILHCLSGLKGTQWHISSRIMMRSSSSPWTSPSRTDLIPVQILQVTSAASSRNQLSQDPAGSNPIWPRAKLAVQGPKIPQT